MATETWVLNYQIKPGSQSYNFTGLNFVSNNSTFDRIYYQRNAVDDGNLSYYNASVETGVYSFYDYSDQWVNEAYRTITFNTAPTGDLLTWLQANGTKQASTPKVTVDLTSLSGYESLPAGTYALGVKAKAANYQDSDLSATVSFTKLAAPVATAANTTVTWDAVTNAESYDVYVDGELYENTMGGVTYNITTTVTNGTYSGDTTITNTATITITADSGYNLPDTVTVTGASYTWNKETGTLTLTNPTGAVTVSAVCETVAVGYNAVFDTKYLTVANTCFYSVDDGATWIDCKNTSGSGTTFTIKTEQIKLKCEGDGSNNGAYTAAKDSNNNNISALSLYAGYNATDTSVNYTLTGNITIECSTLYD